MLLVARKGLLLHEEICDEKVANNGEVFIVFYSLRHTHNERSSSCVENLLEDQKMIR